MRRAPVFPFKDDVTFVALTYGTAPRFDAEDEVRWVTAVGYAALDTDNLKNEGLLSPGQGGAHWADCIEHHTISINGRQIRPEAAILIEGTREEKKDLDDLKDFISSGFGVQGNIILISDRIHKMDHTLNEDIGCHHLRDV